MSPERKVASIKVDSILRAWSWEWAWAAFAVANVVWMELLPHWISIPFHFIWVSFTVLFGFRMWTTAFTWSAGLLVTAGTGIVLIQAWAKGMNPDELFEIPLMFGMFLAMVWHTSRRKAAFASLERVSEQNTRLLQRERAFAQNASHELRTPITVALAHAELAQLTAIKQSVTDDVGIVVEELERLRRLTDRLLLLAAVDAPEFVHPEPIDLATLATATLQRWGATPRLWVMGRRDDAIVLADPDRLILALDTVIENAVKVTGNGDPIELSIGRQGRAAVIEVSDDGPGIPPELLDSIFERFARSEIHHGARAGFGLGLAIVSAIAEAHGGAVTARNRPGGGAVVALRLPLAEERAADAAWDRRAIAGTADQVRADAVAAHPVPLA